MATDTNTAGIDVDHSGTYPWLRRYPRDVLWDSTYEGRPLFELLERAAAANPGNPCTNFFGATINYGEMQRLVNHAAKGLQLAGIGKGSKVGLFMPNCPTFVVAYYAVLRAGGTVVNFNPLYSLDELEHQIKDSGTELMVTLDLKLLFGKIDTLLQKGVLKRAVVGSFTSLLPTVKATLFKLARSKEIANWKASPAAAQIVSQSAMMQNDGKPTAVAIDPYVDLAVLQYTGGTTGVPKGAMLTHANLSINVEQVAAWAGPLVEHNKERIVAILPFFHVFAMTVIMNFGISRAAELVLVPKFEINETMKLLGAIKPTMLPGVPTLFNAILNHRLARQADLRSLKFCFSGGAPLPIEVKRDFEALTGATLIEGYGLSETSPVATANPLTGTPREGSIGLPLPATTLSIRSLDDPSRELPPGEDGEICIKGPQVMPGYWNRPEETADVMVGEFFRTGDIGHMDDEGYTFIIDRLKDMINCSGYKVYPRRIEEVLYEHDAVAEVVVIGVPDKYRGEAPKAFVKLKDGQSATPQALLEHLRPRLARHEMPESIELRDQLPKTPVGKLSKKELKAEELAKRKSIAA